MNTVRDSVTKTFQKYVNMVMRRVPYRPCSRPPAESPASPDRHRSVAVESATSSGSSPNSERTPSTCATSRLTRRFECG
jgi:hypothetical protein